MDASTSARPLKGDLSHYNRMSTSTGKLWPPVLQCNNSRGWAPSRWAIPTFSRAFASYGRQAEIRRELACASPQDAGRGYRPREFRRQRQRRCVVRPAQLCHLIRSSIIVLPQSLVTETLPANATIPILDGTQLLSMTPTGSCEDLSVILTRALYSLPLRSPVAPPSPRALAGKKESTAIFKQQRPVDSEKVRLGIHCGCHRKFSNDLWQRIPKTHLVIQNAEKPWEM